MRHSRLRFLVPALAAIVVGAGMAASATAAPSNLITLEPGQEIQWQGTYLGTANAGGEILSVELGCSKDKPAVGTYFAVGDWRSVAIGVVPRAGSSAPLVKEYPAGSTPPSLPLFSTVFPITNAQTAPTVDGPAQQLYGQVLFDGGNADQFAGFNSGFLGFPDDFEAWITVGPDGNLLPGGFLVALSPTRIEVEQLGPNAQSDLVSQPFDIICTAVFGADASIERMLPLINRLGREQALSLLIGNESTKRRIEAAKRAEQNEERQRKALQKLTQITQLDIGAADYQAAHAEGPLLSAALKTESSTAAKVAPFFKQQSSRRAFQADEKKMQAAGKAAVTELGQMIM